MIDAGTPRDDDARGDWPPPPPPPPAPDPSALPVGPSLPPVAPEAPAEEAGRPRVFAVAMWLVWIGCGIAALDIVANTVGVGTVIWVARDHIDTISLVLVVLVVPALLNLAAWVATMVLARRTAQRRNSARIGLATLMFSFVAGAVVNFSITEIFLIIFALTSWGGHSGMPDWSGYALAGSMIADAVLLLMALVAGILLVVPPSGRWTRPVL